MFSTDSENYVGSIIKMWLSTVNISLSVTVYTPCKFWGMTYKRQYVVLHCKHIGLYNVYLKRDL